MNQQRCPKGHFYDADKFKTCPHCAGGAAANKNVQSPAFSIPSDSDVTVSLDEGYREPQPPTMAPAATLDKEMPQAAPVIKPNLLDDDEKTQGFYNISYGRQEPSVGWLVCTKGSHYGEDFRLKSGRNFIGRSMDMDICLSGENTVSREKHAIVLFEPKMGIFLAQMGESRELVYFNGQLLTGNAEMKKNDRLQLGDVELMLIPCCDQEFSWDAAALKEGQDTPNSSFSLGGI